MGPLLFAMSAYLIGLAGAGVFFVYVLRSGTGVLPYRGWPDSQVAIPINLALLTLFALQHSGMARTGFKKRLGVLGRALYVGASGITLATVTIFWQPIAVGPIWEGPIWIIAISLLGALGIVACCRWFDHAVFFGLAQARSGTTEIRVPLVIAGPFRLVRHPLMLCFLIAIWGQPIMPPELLMLNGGMTIYVLIAIELEEHDLLREFGPAYEEYRRRVPALIPWKW